jgi:hypothetical protein
MMRTHGVLPAFFLMILQVPLQAVKSVVADLEGFDWCRGPPFFMPVLREDWVDALIED